MASTAQEFKSSGTMKEFVDDEGRHFYVIQFANDSGLVFRKTKNDSGSAVAEFTLRDESVTASIQTIASANGITISEGNTQHKLRQLLANE